MPLNNFTQSSVVGISGFYAGILLQAVKDLSQFNHRDAAKALDPIV